jgi:hypothetical protein
MTTIGLHGTATAVPFQNMAKMKFSAADKAGPKFNWGGDKAPLYPIAQRDTTFREVL